MPELTIYTDPNKVGQCDVPPFVHGDTTTAWKLKFNDGEEDYLPESVSVRVGHINGLTSEHDAAFRLNDRAGNYAVYDISALDGIYSLVVRPDDSSAPPELVGSDGVYLARGAKVARGIKQVYAISRGTRYAAAPRVVIQGDGVGAAAVAVMDETLSSGVSQVRYLNETRYGETITATLTGGGGTGAELNPHEVESFRVTGCNFDAQNIAVSLYEKKGTKIPIVFTGTVKDGHTAASGYVQFSPTEIGVGSLYGYATDIVILNEGVYTNRPTATVEMISVVVSLFVSGVTIYKQAASQAGAGYTSTPSASWTPTGSGFALGTADLTGTTSGSLASIPITNGGSGYNYVPRIRLSGATYSTNASHLQKTDVRAIVTGGVITSILINSSASYSAVPTVTIEAPPEPQSIAVDLAPQAHGEVQYVEVTAGGSGYTTAPAVQLICDGVPGGGAAVRAVLTGDAVTGIVVEDAGSAYSFSSPPSVLFSGGGGTGAAATVHVYRGGSITGYTVLAKGSGYSQASVQVIAEDDTGSGATAGAIIEVETNELCFKQSELNQEVIGGVQIAPHTDGRTSATGELFYDNALVFLRPRVIANASFTVSDGQWGGTLNPVNAFVESVLKLKRSHTMDLQVFGDGRMLFMGAITVLNKIQ
jgi:hypothetical protein